MFSNCTLLAFININSIYSHVSLSIDNMFNGCNSIDLINISNIKFDSNTIRMNNMFHGCTSINSMNIFNLKIQRSNHNLKNMFSNCTFLGQLNIFDFQIDGSPGFLYMSNFFRLSNRW